MIYTLTTSLFLWKVNRNRSYYQEQVEKRRAFLLTLGIFSALAVSAYFFLLA